MFVFSACGIPKPPDKNDIADILPEDILSYIFDGNYSILDVKKVEIDKRQTNDKQDIVYAVIELEDNYITKTVYDILYYNYYDEGGLDIRQFGKLSR